MSKKILFVCTGNTCRSAMAAAIMNDIAVKNDLDILIDSAGVFAYEGEAATDDAIKTMANRGIDLTYHRAKRLTDELADMTDIILVMTLAHKDMLNNIKDDKVYTLLEYAGMDGDITDPFGGGLEVYEKTAEQIREALLKISERL